MSPEDIEVVRRFNSAYEGEDIVPPLRESVKRLGPDPQADAVLAEWAADPAYRHVHPEVEWDTSETGTFGTVARGARELTLWWADWIEVWESYVFEVSEYRDLGDWVLSPAYVRARGRGGIAVEMRVFHLFQVRDGKVATMRAFLSEEEALEAAALSSSAATRPDR
jgi:ketosteroid isomerase-like protein